MLARSPPRTHHRMTGPCAPKNRRVPGREKNHSWQSASIGTARTTTTAASPSGGLAREGVMRQADSQTIRGTSHGLRSRRPKYVRAYPSSPRATQAHVSGG